MSRRMLKKIVESKESCTKLFVIGASVPTSPILAYKDWQKLFPTLSARIVEFAVYQLQYLFPNSWDMNNIRVFSSFVWVLLCS